MASKLSIRKSLAGRSIFVTGASGFLGKVWLSMLLDRLPEIGRIYVLLRGKGRTTHDRFEKMVGGSPAFKPLHERFGTALGRYVAERVEIVDGDVALPSLGLSHAQATMLRRETDLVVNIAGLVDFNPDLRDSLSANVDGAINVVEFVESCDHAKLLHISTCYVAGHRDGLIREQLSNEHTPNGTAFDVERELVEVRAAIQKLVADFDGAEVQQRLRTEVLDRMHERGYDESESRVRAMVQRIHRRRLKDAMIDLGTSRAAALGWTNTYTYTKAMAEALICSRAKRAEYSVFRPAIVESAVAFPLPGWNEGFNTCGPLVYLAGTWLRHIPARGDNALDVIPVDILCNGLTIAAAALLEGVHAPVYQSGTSDQNPLSLDRAMDLCALGHRTYLRKNGATALEKLLLSRWDAVHADPKHVLNVGNIRGAVRQVGRFLRHGLPEKLPAEVRRKADELAKTGDNVERKLAQIEGLLELFQPFIYDCTSIFEARALMRHDVVEPEFRFEPQNIEWRSYWLGVHMPGLRRWCYPQYEGKDREKYDAGFVFRLPRAVPSLALVRDEPDAAREEVG